MERGARSLGLDNRGRLARSSDGGPALSPRSPEVRLDGGVEGRAGLGWHFPTRRNPVNVSIVGQTDACRDGSGVKLAGSERCSRSENARAACRCGHVPCAAMRSDGARAVTKDGFAGTRLRESNATCIRVMSARRPGRTRFKSVHLGWIAGPSSILASALRRTRTFHRFESPFTTSTTPNLNRAIVGIPEACPHPNPLPQSGRGRSEREEVARVARDHQLFVRGDHPGRRPARRGADA